MSIEHWYKQPEVHLRHLFKVLRLNFSKLPILRKLYSVFAFLVLISFSAQGQGLSNLRLKTFDINEKPIVLDTLLIVPGTIYVGCADDSQNISEADYSIDYPSSTLTWNNIPECESVQISYRHFPNLFNETYSKKDQGLLHAYLREPLEPVTYQAPREAQDIFDFGSLDYNGSFSRGISFGNAQDLVVNSQFNLQLAGKLSDDIEILAGMTDNNIPFQTQGNTQQLQEFDRIFIQLKKDKSTLLVGDYNLPTPDSHFLNFTRKLQGLNLENESLVGNGKLTSSVSAAIARGQYARNDFIGEEGNQGPYKLTGNAGEVFIIILSGTERVFVDGRELTRGYDFDYIIDYNIGEIIFTPTLMINSGSRIVVEFEYTDRNYLRSFYAASSTYETEKLSVTLNAVSEQDAKNQPLVEELSSSQRNALFLTGDSIQKAFVSGVFPTEFVEERILYRLVNDTIVDGISHNNVYVQSANPEAELFTLSFTDLGQGQGNYVLSNSNLNGRLYDWVPPDPLTGQPTGRFEPVIKLIAPLKRQMLTLGAEYKISEQGTLGGEIAISNLDVNLFSPSHDGDDSGLAARLVYNDAMPLSSDSQWNFKPALKYEYVNERHRSFQRFRAIEFQRIWNIPDSNDIFTQHLGESRLALEKSGLGEIFYGYNIYRQQGFYEGNEHIGGIDFKTSMWELRLVYDEVKSQSIKEEGFFKKPDWRLSHRIGAKKNWNIGTYGLWENIENRNKETQALNSLSTNDLEYFFFVENADTSTFHNQLVYGRQDVKAPSEDFLTFTDAFTSDNLQWNGHYTPNSRNQLRWQTSWRNFENVDDIPSQQEDERSILGNINYNYVQPKGWLRSNSNYRVGSGRERKVEYVFIPTLDNSGSFYWEDINDDGVQQDEEFLLVNENTLTEANRFDRRLVTTTEFINTHQVGFSQSLVLSPKAVWFTSKGLKKFIARFNSETSLDLDRQQLPDEEVFLVFNPFGAAEQDSVIATQSAIRSTLSFNRGGQKYSNDLIFREFEDKRQLISGSTSNFKRDWAFKNRYRLNQKFSTTVNFLYGEQESLSETYELNNFAFDFREVEPSLIYQEGTKWRLTLSYRYRRSFDRDVSAFEALDNRLSAEYRLNQIGKSNFNARLSYSEITYDFPNNQNLQYALLEGLRPGTNWIWNLSYDIRIQKNIQLILGYDGRKTEDNSIRNVARAELKALF